jgi:uncharacterized paraquat-inducible protein A
MNSIMRGVGVALLYVLAAPTYLVVALIKVMKSVSAIRAIRSGVVICPHCRAENDLDVKATCPRCRRTDYGNRLRCRCGNEASSFDCDSCGTTIDL